MTDIAVSILGKLKNRARILGVSYQQCLQLFVQEEFLRKLSFSEYSDKLILKGGLFIYTLTNFESRATIDIDFLLQTFSNTVDDVKLLIDNIIKIDTGNNYITMETKSFEKISPHRKYTGISFQVVAHIKNIRVPFNVDIGIGDVIIPRVEERKICTQLLDFEEPFIKTYSIESTIAEKFDAILQRLELTSRMKDFYDIYYLSLTFSFKGLVLQKALYETLQCRGTSYNDKSFYNVIDLSKNRDMLQRWKLFCKTIKDDTLEFEVVIGRIKDFLEPIFTSIINNGVIDLIWQCKEGKWV